jgi:cobaltochelatase CobN
VSRAARWQQLQAKANADKRLAIIYYNHPPGRQNIGADNLDVPASLFGILQRLKAEGYDTGELPASPEALLDRIMAHGVNLPEDKTALRELAREVEGLSAADYRRWFAGLPERVQGEMVSGPLGRLHAEVLEAERGRAQPRPQARGIGDEGTPPPGRRRRPPAPGRGHRRAEGTGGRLPGCLADVPCACAACPASPGRSSATASKASRLGPGAGQGDGQRRPLLVPGLTFGKIFVGPQPPRGWEVDEELLHANTSVPPPHQFLGFYHWIRDASGPTRWCTWAAIPPTNSCPARPSA